MVKTIRINSLSELHAVVPKRYMGVTNVYINSLLSMLFEGDVDHHVNRPVGINVDFESAFRITQFLTHFGKLERVFFGFVDYGHTRFASAGRYATTNDEKRMGTFIDSISAAYRCGMLSSNVQIYGLSCPYSWSRSNANPNDVTRECETCQRVCQSFSLSAVARFECRGSSRSCLTSGRSHGMDMCLARSQIESIIESRPGGSDCLRSDARALYLLGMGSLIRLTTSDNNGKVLLILKYTQMELNEIKRVIEYADLDVKKLSQHDVCDAIMRSFMVDDTQDPTITRGSCYLSHQSFDYLKDDIGLQIEETSFYESAKYLVPFIPVLTDRIAGYAADTCTLLRLIRHLVECEGESIIQPVYESGLIQIIAALSGEVHKAARFEAAQLINILIEEGNSELNISMVECGACTILMKLLAAPPNENAGEIAIQMMYYYFIINEKCYQKAITRRDIKILIKCLSSTNQVVSKFAIKSLDMALQYTQPSRNIIRVLWGIMPPLLQMMIIKQSKTSVPKIATKLLEKVSLIRPPSKSVCFRRPDQVLEALSQLLTTNDEQVLKIVCIATKRAIITLFDNPPVKASTDPSIEGRLCSQLVKLLSNPIVNNMAIFCICWLTHDKPVSIAALIGNNQALPCINTLLSNRAAKMNACIAIRNILNFTGTHPTLPSIQQRIQLVTQSGIISSLIRILGDKHSSSLLIERALYSIYLVVNKGTQDQVELLLNCGIGPVCCALLAESFSSVKMAVIILTKVSFRRLLYNSYMDIILFDFLTFFLFLGNRSG